MIAPDTLTLHFESNFPRRNFFQQFLLYTRLCPQQSLLWAAIRHACTQQWLLSTVPGTACTQQWLLCTVPGTTYPVPGTWYRKGFGISVFSVLGGV